MAQMKDLPPKATGTPNLDKYMKKKKIKKAAESC